MTHPRPTSHSVHVTDRTWQEMLAGAEFLRWPDGPIPRVGERVTVFDRNLDLTQHDVVRRRRRRVWLGPAIPYHPPTQEDA